MPAIVAAAVLNCFAPIVTGCLVKASRSFSSAFIAAGVLALTGAVVTLVLSRGTIGGHLRGTIGGHLQCDCPEPVAPD
jgi:hypothetical protein